MTKISGVHKILISRTDAIGDVVLTLPLAAMLKELCGPDVKIAFLGKTYTYDVIKCCQEVDEFYNYDTFRGFDQAGRVAYLKDTGADAILHVFPVSEIAGAAKQAGIRHRIGTTNRLYHWWTCNHLVSFSRRSSDLHEAILNTYLLKDFGLSELPAMETLSGLKYLTRVPQLPEKYRDLLSQRKFRLILHPGSNESARNWNLTHYRDLARYLSPERFQIFITGTRKEKERMQDWLATLPSNTVDLSGKLSLEELIALIDSCDGMVAASTGPLHIASALGKRALGIYPPIRPMHPGRWAPVGKYAEVAVVERNCSDCRDEPQRCHCINEISASQIADRVGKWERV